MVKIKIILDTNVYIDAIAGFVPDIPAEGGTYGLDSGRLSFRMPFAVYAELKACAKRRQWQSKKLQMLQAFCAASPLIGVNESVVHHFVDLHNFALSKGKPMQANDLWIAATALAMNATLITNDGDFSVLKNWPALKISFLKSSGKKPCL